MWCTRLRRLSCATRNRCLNTNSLAPAGTTVVTNIESATRVAAQLREVSQERPFACDTEVNGFDTKKGPINNGQVCCKEYECYLTPMHARQVICLSIYGGDDLDFGAGPAIWVDTEDSMVVNDFSSKTASVLFLTFVLAPSPF